MRITVLPIIGLFITLLSCNTGAQTNYLNAKEFNENLLKDQTAVLVDVRTPEEYNSGKIASAINIDFYRKDFAEAISKLNPKEPIYLYCRSGSRSDKAMTILLKSGFKHIYMLEGGIQEWNNQNLPIELNGSNESIQDNTNDSEAESAMLKSIQNKKLAVLDFYAEWCIPCKKMEPDLAALSNELKGKVELIRIDVDKYTQIASSYNVNAMPTLVYIVNGKEAERTVGYQSKEDIQKHLNSYLQP